MKNRYYYMLKRSCFSGIKLSSIIREEYFIGFNLKKDAEYSENKTSAKKYYDFYGVMKKLEDIKERMDSYNFNFQWRDCFFFNIEKEINFSKCVNRFELMEIE